MVDFLDVALIVERGVVGIDRRSTNLNRTAQLRSQNVVPKQGRKADTFKPDTVHAVLTVSELVS